MKTNLIPKLLLMFAFCLMLNSCTTDSEPEQNAPAATEHDPSQGGPVIPSPPKP